MSAQYLLYSQGPKHVLPLVVLLLLIFALVILRSVLNSHMKAAGISASLKLCVLLIVPCLLFVGWFLYFQNAYSCGQ